MFIGCLPFQDVKEVNHGSAQPSAHCFRLCMQKEKFSSPLAFSIGRLFGLLEATFIVQCLEAQGTMQHICGKSRRLYLFFANTLTVLGSPRPFFPWGKWPLGSGEVRWQICLKKPAWAFAWSLFLVNKVLYFSGCLAEAFQLQFQSSDQIMGFSILMLHSWYLLLLFFCLTPGSCLS